MLSIFIADKDRRVSRTIGEKELVKLIKLVGLDKLEKDKTNLFLLIELELKKVKLLRLKLQEQLKSQKKKFKVD